MWEDSLNINEVRELRTRSNVYFGVGAINKMAEIAAALKAQGVNSVLVVAGKSSYKSTGAWSVVEKALKDNAISWVIYDKVTPNPTTHQVDEAAALGSGADAVIAIGGGSPIDAGKSAAILIANPGKSAQELYEMQFAPAKALPIVAINLTHGTGSETNRFAVVSIPEKDYKPAIAYDCIYPMFAIDDPALTCGLSPKQTRYVSIDVVNHVIEAATTIFASPLTELYGKEAIRLVAKYLPRALADGNDLKARYYLHYASMLGGVSFDNGLLHYTHALEHPLSAVEPELSHGLGLAVLLPAVVKNIYPARAEMLADILEAIVPGLKGTPDEAHAAGKGVENWLFSVGVTEKLADLGLGEKDLDRLTDLAYETPGLAGLLASAPTTANRAVVRQIYADSLKAL